MERSSSELTGFGGWPRSRTDLLLTSQKGDVSSRQDMQAVRAGDQASSGRSAGPRCSLLAWRENDTLKCPAFTPTVQYEKAEVRKEEKETATKFGEYRRKKRRQLPV